MSFAAALSSLETHTRQATVFGTPAVLNGRPMMVTVTPIELVQPWMAGGYGELPTCEVALAISDWEIGFTGKLGEMIFTLGNGSKVRVHKRVGETLSSEVRLLCGPIDN